MTDLSTISDDDLISEMFAYDPLSGLVAWNVRYRSMQPGDPAGTINSHGYRVIRLRNRYLYAHRVAWFLQFGRWPSLVIDHINGDKADNRLSNLREASRSENNTNQPNRRGKLGLPRGVIRLNRKFAAQIKVKGVRHYLGAFDTPDEAHAAYRKASLEAHGEFSVFAKHRGAEDRIHEIARSA